MRRRPPVAAITDSRRGLHASQASAALVLTSEGRACGFHDDVSIARGALNWTYPDALHVIGAISSAVAQKRLRTGHPTTTASDLFGSRYHATAKALERFAELLGGGSDDAPALSFSLVLVEPMLWTHFEAGPRGPRAQAHVSGPQSDQLVLVSGQNVIRAIANKELGIAEADRLGLIRLYGSRAADRCVSAMFQGRGAPASRRPGSNPPRIRYRIAFSGEQ